MILKKNWLILILVCPIIFFCLQSVAVGSDRIFADGYFEDWDSVPVMHQDPAGDQQSGELDFTDLKITNDERFLFINTNLNMEINLQSENNVALYIDTDNNSGTGTLVNGIGADLVWMFGDRYGQFYSSSGTHELSHADIGLVTTPTVTSERFEITLDRTLSISGYDLFPGLTGKYVLRDLGSGQDIIPDSGEFITYTIDETPIPDLPVITLERNANTHARIMTYNVWSDNFFETGLFDEYSRIFTAINPDIIGFQEIYDHSAQDTADRIESILGSGNQWYGAGTYPDVILVSRFPILSTTPVDGNAAFLVDLSEVSGTELLIVAAHLPAGDNNYDRQLEVDRIMALIRDARETGGSMGLLENTPIIIMGDMNFVGYAAQLDTLLTGNIVNSQYGPSFDPDWDNSTFTDPVARLTEIPLFYTWYKSYSAYSPGRMDFMIYSDSVMEEVKKFVLTTPEMSSSQLLEWGLNVDDTQEASDHQPLVVDFVLGSGEPTPTPGNPSPSPTPSPSVNTPTPSPTFSSTETPGPATNTPGHPTETPVPTALETGVELRLSSSLFEAGDSFRLDAFLTNSGPEMMVDQPLVVLLDVYSSYFWYPTWSETFTYETYDLDVGSNTISLLAFNWPETSSAGSGILIYSAFLNQEMTQIVGSWDMVSFGWN